MDTRTIKTIIQVVMDERIAELKAVGKPNEAYMAEQARDAAMHRISRYEDCRNELCLKCGKYENKHNGACNGCRWDE